MKKAITISVLPSLCIVGYHYPTEMEYVLLGFVTILVLIVAVILGVCVLAMSDTGPPSPPPRF